MDHRPSHVQDSRNNLTFLAVAEHLALVFVHSLCTLPFTGSFSSQCSSSLVTRKMHLQARQYGYYDDNGYVIFSLSVSVCLCLRGLCDAWLCRGDVIVCESASYRALSLCLHQETKPTALCTSLSPSPTFLHHPPPPPAIHTPVHLPTSQLIHHGYQLLLR